MFLIPYRCFGFLLLFTLAAQFVQWKLFDGTASLKENPLFKQQLNSAVPDKSLPLLMMCRFSAPPTPFFPFFTSSLGLPNDPFLLRALQQPTATSRTTYRLASWACLTKQQVRLASLHNALGGVEGKQLRNPNKSHVRLL